MMTTERGSDYWNRSADQKNLEKHLGAAGYVELEPDEIVEAVAVPNGALSGPKSALMKGQTRYLKVLKIKLKYQLRGEEIRQIAMQRMPACS